MDSQNLQSLLKDRETIEREGIFISKQIAEKTVWDTLAEENPTHAVISAKDEADAAKKSAPQIADIAAHLQPTDVLLDCGAGYGRVAKYLLPQMQLGGYVGVDSAYQMLKLFAQRYQETPAEQKTPVLFVNADIHTLPLKDSSVDVAIVCAVFLHNHKNVVAQAVSELARVVKPGGKVLVYSSFPRSVSAVGLQGAIHQMVLNLLGKPYKNGPVRYYRRKEIYALFSNFSEVELVPVGFQILPKTIVILPNPIGYFYRVGIANPFNAFMQKITPARLQPYLAVHYDVVAKL